MSTANVRYIVNDVDAAIGVYGDLLGFEVVMHPAPTFAILARGVLRLLLSAPSARGGGGEVRADGSRPEPGGWNRISLEVADLPGARSSACARPACACAANSWRASAVTRRW